MQLGRRLEGEGGRPAIGPGCGCSASEGSGGLLGSDRKGEERDRCYHTALAIAQRLGCCWPTFTI